jgi:hypothetical protein
MEGGIGAEGDTAFGVRDSAFDGKASRHHGIEGSVAKTRRSGVNHA